MSKVVEDMDSEEEATADCGFGGSAEAVVGAVVRTLLELIVIIFGEGAEANKSAFGTGVGELV